MNTMPEKRPTRRSALLAALLALALAVPPLQAEDGSNFQIGVGANYWVALDDAVDESFDEDGLGWMISTRYMATPYFGFGLELERSPDNYVALKAAGVPMIGYGDFLTQLVNFLILAWIVFLIVKMANKLVPSPVPGPTQVDLLAEIRDELRRKP